LTNFLLHAERRGRISTADITQRLELIAQLPLQIDEQTATRAARETLALARAYKLTIYDAAYLELATRKGTALATKDKALAQAAEIIGVPVRGR
jgi:predicted nucleic acid-binding protein